MCKGFFISGTDTNVGKTIISALLVKKLDAIYWKPIQCGVNKFGQKDSDIIEKLTENKILKEFFFFKHPLSPNIAALKANKKVYLKDFEKFLNFEFSKKIIIEGAGGLNVPINNKSLIVDLVKYLKLPLVLVSRTSLGTINHTLLSIEILKKKKISLHGLIFCGKNQPDTIDTILNHGKLIYGKKINFLGRVPYVKKIDKKSIKELGKKILI